MDHASLLAAFPLPVANAAPATPVFANLINLMFSPQTAPPPSSLKTAASSQATAASPAQIADAMIRSMLDGPLSGTAASGNSIPASTASVAIPNQALSLSNPPIAPKAAVLRDDPPPVQLPLTAGNANPPLGTTNPNPPAQAPRKQPRTAADALMTAVTPVVTMPALPAAVTPPAVDPKSNASAPATRDSTESVATLPVAKNSAEAKIAFTAILTPAKDGLAPTGPVASPAMPKPEPAGAENFSITTASQPAAKLATAANAQPQAASASQVMAAEPGGNAQPEGDASQQGHDSPESPARPVAVVSATKSKPDVQQDENAMPAAATPVVAHPVAVASFTASPTDPTRTSAPAQAATPYNATAEAVRTTESNLAAAPPLRTGAVQEISIRIAPPDAPAVDLHVVERAGQVHVDVRTSDSAMQTSLRQDLGTLTNSLQRAGYHTETFTPSSTLGRASSSAQANNQDQQDPSRNRGGAGDFSGDRRQQQQKRSGPWLEELEEQS